MSLLSLLINLIHKYLKTTLLTPNLRMGEYLFIGMHWSDTQGRYRLWCGHFMRIGYRWDETDPNLMFWGLKLLEEKAQ